MKKILNAWCILYGWYVSVGDWMVKQVDSNDYLAGFLGALAMYSDYYMGDMMMQFIIVIGGR